MQSKINNDVQLTQSLNPLNDIVKVPSIDNLSNQKDAFTKLDKHFLKESMRCQIIVIKRH